MAHYFTGTRPLPGIVVSLTSAAYLKGTDKTHPLPENTYFFKHPACCDFSPTFITMLQQIHHYSNNEITVICKPESCIHSAICFKGLSTVFDPGRRPWIEMGKSTTERIMELINKCPSRALSFYKNEPRS